MYVSLFPQQLFQRNWQCDEISLKQLLWVRTRIRISQVVAMEQYYLQELPYKASPCPWGSFLPRRAWRWGGRAGRSAPGSSGGRLARGSCPGRGGGSLQVDRWRVAVELEHSDSTHMRWSVVSFPETSSFIPTQHCLIPLVLLPSVLHTCKKKSSIMEPGKAGQWEPGNEAGPGSLGAWERGWAVGAWERGWAVGAWERGWAVGAWERGLGTRLGSGSLGTRLGSGSLGTRLGSGSLGTRLDTSQIPGSELPPSAPLTSGIREWFRGITRGFPLSPTLPPSSSTSLFLLLLLLFLPLSLRPLTGTNLRLLWSFSRHWLV